MLGHAPAAFESQVDLCLSNLHALDASQRHKSPTWKEAWWGNFARRCGGECAVSDSHRIRPSALIHGKIPRASAALFGFHESEAWQPFGPCMSVSSSGRNSSATVRSGD